MRPSRNQRQIDTRDVDHESDGDKKHANPEAPILMRTFPIRNVVIWIPRRMRSFLWVVVMFALTHVRKADGFQAVQRLLHSSCAA
jgi:hypothetical protein